MLVVLLLDLHVYEANGKGGDVRWYVLFGGSVRFSITRRHAYKLAHPRTAAANVVGIVLTCKLVVRSRLDVIMTTTAPFFVPYNPIRLKTRLLFVVRKFEKILQYNCNDCSFAVVVYVSW